MAHPKDFGSVRFNTNALKRANEGGYTQAELGRATVKRARETGKDISQVVGRRRPTERYIDGRWVRV